LSVTGGRKITGGTQRIGKEPLVDNECSETFAQKSTNLLAQVVDWPTALDYCWSISDRDRQIERPRTIYQKHSSPLPTGFELFHSFLCVQTWFYTGRLTYLKTLLISFTLDIMFDYLHTQFANNFCIRVHLQIVIILASV